MDFYYTNISNEIKNRIFGISYPKECEVPLNDLKYVKVLHYDFHQNIKTGELIVNTLVAKDITKIFKELYDNKYPVEKIRLIDEYDADDEKSMADNNTSCFNYRRIDSSSTLSSHSYGLAVDINPLYNPYVRTGFGNRNILPAEGAKFVDRTLNIPGLIVKDDICYRTFIKKGWQWGGDWTDRKDYQHFYKIFY
jgi:hypothetical protein